MITKIRLLFKNVSEIVGNQDVGLLILVNESETRQLTIPCNSFILKQFELRLSHAGSMQRTLPEVLWQIIDSQTILHHEIIIDNIDDGEYKAMLYNMETLHPIPINAQDAVLLSYISSIPIYITTSLFEKQSVSYDIASHGVSLPVNVISYEMLEEALSKAIRDENYELASHLRDEIERRKNDNK